MDGYFSDSQTMQAVHKKDDPSPVSPVSDAGFMTPMFDEAPSRRSSRLMSVNPLTPPNFTPEALGQNVKSSHPNGMHMSHVDPGQLTENLHASLVSEILSLRRDIESKAHLIDSLETSLSSSKQEVDLLESKLSKNSREHRSVKRQIQAIEDSTLHAIEEVAKERDESRLQNADLKKRLDASQTKARSLDAEAKRLTDALDRERKGWDSERLTLQRKASNAERRLQHVVEELAVQQHQAHASVEDETEDMVDEDVSTPDQQRSPAKGHGRSRSSISSTATKKLPGPGLSLAEELDMNDDDDEDANDASDGEADKIPHTGRDHERSMSQSTQTAEERRVPEMVSHFHFLTSSSRILPAREDNLKRKSIASFSSLPDEGDDLASQTNGDIGRLAKAQVQEPALEQQPRHPPDEIDASAGLGSSTTPDDHAAVSDAPATSNACANEPVQAGTGFKCLSCQKLVFKEAGDVSSVATQTDMRESPQANAASMIPVPSRAPPAIPSTQPEVPIIAIHPPESAETSPRVSLLPPRTKSIGCQTEPLDTPAPMQAPVKPSMQTTGMQTEAIRVDQRAYKLPPHLLPEALSQSSLSSAATTEKDMSPVFDDLTVHGNLNSRLNHPYDSPPSSLPASTHDLLEKSLFDDNDSPDWAALKRSLLATSGHSAKSSYQYNHNDHQNNDDSDDDYSIPFRRTGPRLSRHARPFMGPPTPVPEDEKAINTHADHRSKASISSKDSFERVREGRVGGHKYSRRRSVISDSTIGHSRASSLGSLTSSNFTRSTAGPRPPFAIPARSSSRYPRKSRRLRSDGQASPTKSSGQASQGRGSRSSKRPPPLRKAQSAAVLKPRQSEDSSLRSELTPRSVAFSIEDAPPLPTKVISVHHHSNGRSAAEGSRQYSKPATSIHPTGSTSVAGSLQYSVVDAITATMIGEWMFKYVRKRSSSSKNDEFAATSDSRHKRWMWLSPYERMIMWSSKQPTSNAALMGKNGRKLAIQSVLDVKDSTPAPKGVDPNEFFDRSILILTPVRALKITATSRDRHFLWLTALSFLAHNTSHGIPDLRFLPPNPNYAVKEEIASNNSSIASRASSIRRAGLASSFRNGKSKSSVQSSGRTTPAVSDIQPTAAPYPFKSQAQVSESAAAPVVPRVPHSRKRSVTNPSRGRNSLISGSLRSSSAAANDRARFYSGNASVQSFGDRKSSLRAAPASGASSTRNLPAAERGFGRDQDTLLEEEDDELGHLSISRPRYSPTKSLLTRASAEFGGNSSFFDAVGFVRMDAFVPPVPPLQSNTEAAKSTTSIIAPPLGDLGFSRPSMPVRPPPPVPGNDLLPLGGVTGGHRRNEESKDSFIGPPNISRVREGPKVKPRDDRKWGFVSSKAKAKENEKLRRVKVDQL